MSAEANFELGEVTETAEGLKCDKSAQLCAAMVLRIASVAPSDPASSRAAGRAILDVIGRLDDLVSVSFRIAGQSGVLSAGFVLEGFDTAQAAARLQVAVESLAPWMTLAIEPIADADPLSIPSKPSWASSIRVGEVQDLGARASGFSPVASALTRSDALVSVMVASSTDGDGEAVMKSDVIVVSQDHQTDVVAALLAAELESEENIATETCHGAGAQLLVTRHLEPVAGLNVGVFADLFSIPSRARTQTAWSVDPVKPASTEEVLAAVTSDKHLHSWIIGRTGMGKSTFAENLILADIRAGKSVIVIDPHGPLAERVAELVSELAPDRLDWADFGAEKPPVLNPLLGEDGQGPDELNTAFREAIGDLWEAMPGEYFGPVFDRLLQLVVDAVLRHDATPSLATVVALLQGDKRVTEEVMDSARRNGDFDLIEAFEKEAGNLGRRSSDGGTTTISLWANSKLAPWLQDSRVARIVAGEANTLCVSKVAENNRILVAEVPVGSLGRGPVRVIGHQIISRLDFAMTRLHHESGGAVNPRVALYVDEWPVVTPEGPIKRMLAAARKTGLEITILNQSVRQVSDPLEVAANIGTLAAFRLGPAEANLFAPEFETISESALRRLAPFQVAVRPPRTQEVVGWTPPPWE